MSSAGLESNDWRRKVYLTQKEKQRTIIKNLIERIIIILLERNNLFSVRRLWKWNTKNKKNKTCWKQKPETEEKNKWNWKKKGERPRKLI